MPGSMTRLRALAAGAAAVLAATAGTTAARAQSAPPASLVPAPTAAAVVETAAIEGDAARSGEASAATSSGDVAGERELGLRLGAAMGSGLTPGGLRFTGLMLYRMSAADWFEGSLGFTFGNPDASCFADRDGAFTCDPGAVSGAAIDLGAGVRRFVAVRGQFAPYLRAGLGVRVARYSDDSLTGLAMPVVAGAGVRARLSERVAVGADAAVEVGPAWFGRGLGAELELGMGVVVTADVRLY